MLGFTSLGTWGLEEESKQQQPQPLSPRKKGNNLHQPQQPHIIPQKNRTNANPESHTTSAETLTQKSTTNPLNHPENNPPNREQEKEELVPQSPLVVAAAPPNPNPHQNSTLPLPLMIAAQPSQNPLTRNSEQTES